MASWEVYYLYHTTGSSLYRFLPKSRFSLHATERPNRSLDANLCTVFVAATPRFLHNIYLSSLIDSPHCLTLPLHEKWRIKKMAEEPPLSHGRQIQTPHISFLSHQICIPSHLIVRIDCIHLSSSPSYRIIIVLGGHTACNVVSNDIFSNF